MSVLRDLTTTPALHDALHKLVNQPGDPILGLEPQPRLTPRWRDADFFRKHVQTSGAIETLLALDRSMLPTDAQKAVRDNATALHRELVGWSEERRLGLVRMLGERTFLVVVATPDLESAHRIFSVMNSRGLDLSRTDGKGGRCNRPVVSRRPGLRPPGPATPLPEGRTRRCVPRAGREGWCCVT